MRDHGWPYASHVQSPGGRHKEEEFYGVERAKVRQAIGLTMQDTLRIADAALEERLGHKFSNPELLDRALTHSSAIPELRGTGTDVPADLAYLSDNERLEFLGDAVLELLASEYLLAAFPGWTEGQLSKSRARIVNASSLELAGRRLRLGEHLRLGRGEEKTGGREKQTLLADAFEAVVAAVYLDAVIVQYPHAPRVVGRLGCLLVRIG